MENKEELKEMRASAKMAIAGFAAAATASCAVPIPIADAFILIGEQVTMMGVISTIYKLDIKKKTLHTLVFGVLGASGMSLAGKTIVSSAFKFIPGIGSVAGSLISAGTAGILTHALGNAFIELCEAVKRGDLSEDDIGKKGLKYLKEIFERLRQEGEGKYSDGDSSADSLHDESDETDKNTSQKTDGGIDLSKISFSNLEGMDKYDTNYVNINYDGKLIGSATLVMKKYQETEKKAVLYSVIIEKNYRGKHIFSHMIKQISNLYPVEILIEGFPKEYEGMAKHLLSFENVLAGK